jgi:excisionase family DNA binding protein
VVRTRGFPWSAGARSERRKPTEATLGDGLVSRLLTAEQMAAQLNVHPETIYRRARMGELPCFRLGPVLRFDLEEVKDAMREGAVQRRVDPPDERSTR